MWRQLLVSVIGRRRLRRARLEGRLRLRRAVGVPGGPVTVPGRRVRVPGMRAGTVLASRVRCLLGSALLTREVARVHRTVWRRLPAKWRRVEPGRIHVRPPATGGIAVDRRAIPARIGRSAARHAGIELAPITGGSWLITAE